MEYYLLIIWYTSQNPRAYMENSKVEGRNRQNRFHLESRTPSWAGLWTLSICPVSMEMTYQLKNQTPWMEEPKGSYLDSLLPKRIP